VTLDLRVKDTAQTGLSHVSLTLERLYNFYGSTYRDHMHAVTDGSVSVDSNNYGDVDGDGVIDSADVTLLRRYVAASDKGDFLDRNPGFNLENADVNGDSRIDSADITLLRRYIAASNKSLTPLGPR
jgi:ribosomal protein S18